MNLTGSPATVLGISGDGQTTTTRSPSEAPLRMLVLDETGHVVAGAPVTFRIQTGYAGLTGTAAFPGGAQSADFPDDETATAALLQVGSLGSIRSNTMRAFSADEITTIIGKTG